MTDDWDGTDNLKLPQARDMKDSWIPRTSRCFPNDTKPFLHEIFWVQFIQMRMTNLTFTADWLEQSAHTEPLSARAAALLLRRALARLARGGAAQVPEVRGRHKRDIGQARPVTEPLGQPHCGRGREQQTLKWRSMKIIPHTPVERRMLRNQKYFMFSSPLASQNLTGSKYLGTGRIILMVMDVIGSCYWSRNNYASQTSKNNQPGSHFHFLSLNLRSWQR